MYDLQFTGKTWSSTTIVHDAVVFVFVYVFTMLGHSACYMGSPTVGWYVPIVDF